MNIQNPQDELKLLSQRLITDIMRIVPLHPNFQATVYIEEVGDFPVYTRYQVQNLQFNEDIYPCCTGFNPITGEMRQIFLSEINTEWLIDIYNALLSLPVHLPLYSEPYTFADTHGDVVFLQSPKNKLSYFFKVNGVKYHRSVKEGTITYSEPLAACKNYSIKFEYNCTSGFCVFNREQCLETFWDYQKALQFMHQLTV